MSAVENIAAAAERVIAAAEATAAHNILGAAPDPNGVTMAQWLAHYSRQAAGFRDLAKTMRETATLASRRAEPLEKIDAALDGLEKFSDRLDRLNDPDLREAATSMRAEMGRIRKIRSEFGRFETDVAKALGAPVEFDAVISRLDGFLALPALRPGETGAPMHLIGRAIMPRGSA